MQASRPDPKLLPILMTCPVGVVIPLPGVVEELGIETLLLILNRLPIPGELDHLPRHRLDLVPLLTDMAAAGAGIRSLRP